MKAIFLDRDGTINSDVNYLIRFQDFILLDGVSEALGIFQELGFHIFVITNQSGVARGYFSEEDVKFLNRQIEIFFKNRHIEITKTKYCPHYKNGVVAEYSIDCDCRKPKPGMILELQSEYDIELKESYMIGDKLCDVQAGVNAGTKPVLLTSGSEVNKTGSDLDVEKFNSLIEFAVSLKQRLTREKEK